MEEKFLDDIDFKILEMLAEDSKVPYAEIARKLDLSRAVVTNRVNSMMAKEVIKRFAILIDPRKLGKDISVLFEIDTIPLKTQEILSEISKQEDIGQVFITGTASVFAYGFFNDTKHLNEFVSTIISKLDGVKGIKTNFILESYNGKSLLMANSLVK